MRILGFVLLSGLAFASGRAAAAEFTTGDQLRSAIVGNTIVGSEEGRRYTEVFLPDGTIHGMDSDGAYFGKWRIIANEICMSYLDSGEQDGKWTCVRAAENGDEWIWIDDGERSQASLVKGNPNNL